MNTTKILETAEAQCTGCLRCMLACSFFTSGKQAFNPALSKIRVEPGSGDGEFEIVLLKAKNGYGEKAFRKHLEIEDISPAEWKSELKNNLLVKKLIDKMVNDKVSVNEEEIKKYFAEHAEEFHKGKQVLLGVTLELVVYLVHHILRLLLMCRLFF